ncbi:MAG: hypothetical protein Q9178_007435 [Gyalolechia marmorata]
MEHRQRESPNTQLPFQQLLNHNDLGVIENPLRRVAEEHVIKSVREFHQENHLDSVVDVATCIRGARLARQEEIFTTREGDEGPITEVERAALDKEKRTSIWTDTRELKIILLTCSLGSVLQGWVQGAIVAANQVWPGALGLESLKQNGPTQTGGLPHEVWAFSATNAIVYFAAATVGAFLCDPLTEVLTGRRAAIFVAAFFTFISSIGEASAQTWQSLLAWRFFLGIGMGAKSSVIPIYLSEVSPARLRGRVLTSWQTGTALGIAISGAISLGIPESSESPRWLIKKQRYKEAYIVLSRLRGNPLLAARDLIFIYAQLQVETTLFTRTDQDIVELENQIPYLETEVYRHQIGLFGYARRITQLFTIPRARRATLASFLVMSAQILSGVNIFAFLAATLFEPPGEPQGKPHGPRTTTNRTSLWLFFIFGISNFLYGAETI